jgi:hypothetical protein
LNKEISKLPVISVKNGMTTEPHLPWTLLSIVVGVGRMMILSWIQSEDWNITAGVMGGELFDVKI